MWIIEVEYQNNIYNNYVNGKLTYRSQIFDSANDSWSLSVRFSVLQLKLNDRAFIRSDKKVVTRKFYLGNLKIKRVKL